VKCFADQAPTASEPVVWLADVNGRDKPGHDRMALWICADRFVREGRRKVGTIPHHDIPLDHPYRLV
jgi:hypothetical protein